MLSARQAPCVRQAGARGKEACPGQYLPVAWGSGLRLQLRVGCTLLARSRAVQCVKAATTGSFLPAGWRVLAGQEGQLPSSPRGSSGVLASSSLAQPAGLLWHGPGVPLGTPEGSPEHASSSRLLQHLHNWPSPPRALHKAGGRRGGQSVRAVLVSLGAAGAGAGLGATVTDTVQQAATSGHLFLAPGTAEGTQWEAGSGARRS